MNIRPEDLPTLRQHYSYFYLNERAIPIVYRFDFSLRERSLDEFPIRRVFLRLGPNLVSIILTLLSI